MESQTKVSAFRLSNRIRKACKNPDCDNDTMKGKTYCCIDCKIEGIRINSMLKRLEYQASDKYKFYQQKYSKVKIARMIKEEEKEREITKLYLNKSQTILLDLN